MGGIQDQLVGAAKKQAMARAGGALKYDGNYRTVITKRGGVIPAKEPLPDTGYVLRPRLGTAPDSYGHLIHKDGKKMIAWTPDETKIISPYRSWWDKSWGIVATIVIIMIIALVFIFAIWPMIAAPKAADIIEDKRDENKEKKDI